MWRDVCTALKQSEPTCASNPFNWHSFIVPHITDALDRSVWACRDIVRHMEHNRSSVHLGRVSYVLMHEVARHAIHITENIDMSSKVLKALKQEVGHGQRMMLSCSIVHKSELAEVLRMMRGHSTLLECAHGRSCALTSRLQNEINLVGCASDQY